DAIPILRYDGILLSIIIGFILGLGSTFVLYKFLFYPDIKKTAQRLDKLGLEERMITMLELKEDTSFIAELQREDTKVKVASIPPKKFKFVNLAKYIGVVVLGFIAVSSMSIALAIEVAPKYYTIEWVIDGQKSKTEVLENTMPEKETPIKEGYVFYKWEPELEPATKNTSYTAIFLPESVTDEERIIKELIEALRQIVDSANVSQTLKDDLHGLIDNLEESLKPEDSLIVKIAKIEDTRDEILRRIREEIRYIGDELKAFEITDSLGDAVLENNALILKLFIDNFVADFEAMPVSPERTETVLQTADDIEAAMKNSNEYNPALRKTLQELADLLRRMAINTIAEELQKHETTETLGDAVATRDNDLLDQFIEEFVQDFIDMPTGPEKIELLLQTADDIEQALEDSNEDNDPLREQLQALADLLRKMAQIIEEGDIPEDQAQEQLEQELQEIIDQIKDILNPEPQDDEGDLEQDIEDAFEDAIGELTGQEPNEEEPEDPED